MHGTVKYIFQKLIVAATAACLLPAVAFPALAARTVPVLEQKTTDDVVVLYVQYPGEVQSADAQIGMESAEVTVDGEQLPIVTWLLLDNSLSLGRENQIKAKELLTTIVAGRLPEERFNLCTFSDDLTVLMQDSKSYPDLKQAIDSITYEDQETYLTDVLYAVLDAEREREGTEYTRVVVISDGVDNNPQGITKDELTRRLANQNIPIYTFGCKSRNNEQALKELFAISRQTGAESWTLGEMSNLLDAVNSLGGASVPKRAVISIPDALKDGSVKGIRLIFNGDGVAETQVTMPFGEAVEPLAPETETTPEPEDGKEAIGLPVPEDQEVARESVAYDFSKIIDFVRGYKFLFIAGLAVIILVIVLATVLGTRKKKEKRGAEAAIQTKDTEDALDFTEGTDILGPAGLGEEGTMILVDGNSRLMLTLTDLTHPDRAFEVPIQGAVSIGRDTSNRIVLDYDRSVSGKHCEIYMSGNALMVRDRNSANGTIVDGMRVADTAELSNGSKLRLGRLEFVVGIR